MKEIGELEKVINLKHKETHRNKNGRTLKDIKYVDHKPSRLSKHLAETTTR